MRYKPKSSAALQIALGGLPAQMPVKVDADIEVSARTVGELRKLTAWPENLAITTPQDGYPDSGVRVSKVSLATRTSPKCPVQARALVVGSCVADFFARACCAASAGMSLYLERSGTIQRSRARDRCERRDVRRHAAHQCAVGRVERSF